jgi:hypothetical protein
MCRNYTKKLSALHYLLVVEPDVEIPTDAKASKTAKQDVIGLPVIPQCANSLRFRHALRKRPGEKRNNNAFAGANELRQRFMTGDEQY